MDRIMNRSEIEAEIDRRNEKENKEDEPYVLLLYKRACILYNEAWIKALVDGLSMFEFEVPYTKESGRVIAKFQRMFAKAVRSNRHTVTYTT
jgi:hypothetical protein